MKSEMRSGFSLFGAILFWLLPFAGMPLAFARLTGNKVPLFGVVKFFDFTALGIIALVLVVLRAKYLYDAVQSSKLLRFTGLAGIVILFAAFIQQYLYGGSWEHFGAALFYAATPLAAAAFAPELKRALPFAAAAGSVLLLWSGAASENFTGLAGNWNWTQGLLFALLPASMCFLNRRNFVRNTVSVTAIAVGAGIMFYPEIISRSVLIALPLLTAGMWIWFKFSRDFRRYCAPLLFIAMLAIPVLLGAFCNISDSRIHLYRAGVNLLKDHGIIGVGMGRFFEFIPEYLAPEYFLAPFSAPHHPHPHNELLNIWSGFGIAGLFYTGVLFCGMLYRFPRRRFTPGKLLPFWIFFFIFLCAQTDLTGAILTGAFWMLSCAGIVFAPVPAGRSAEPPLGNKLIAAVLTVFALFWAVENFRATGALRQGRLAAMKNDAANALKFYQLSSRIRPTKEALYGNAEIYLHAQGDFKAVLTELAKLHTVLGFDNYLHTNRMKAVALVNCRQAESALPFIVRDAGLYPYSVISARLHLMLLEMLRRPAAEVEAARNVYDNVCRKRGISPERGAAFTMSQDDEAPVLESDASEVPEYRKLFPGIFSELAAALTLFFATLGVGALVCFKRRQRLPVELGIGIILCSVPGALFAGYMPCILLMLMPLGIAGNWEKFRRNWKTVLFFGIITLFMAGNALLPPGTPGEQICHTALLKHYAGNGFFVQPADNPLSASFPLVHAYLLCGFSWGGATLPRLMNLLFAGVAGAYMFNALCRYGKSSAGMIFGAVLLSPLYLLMVRNFHVEPFILIFALAGCAVLLKKQVTQGDCIILGIFAGAAVAVKLSGVAVAAALAVFLCFKDFKWKNLLLFLFFAVSTVLLFYLRNCFYWGSIFYPYGSSFFNSSAERCLVERFHQLANGIDTENFFAGTGDVLRSAFVPHSYAEVFCGFQFPLVLLAALAGSVAVCRKLPQRRKVYGGALAALATFFIIWMLFFRQLNMLYLLIPASAALALAGFSEVFSPRWKYLLAVLAVVATLVSLMNQSGLLMHFYFSYQAVGQVRRHPGSFASGSEFGYSRLLSDLNKLPENAEIASLYEQRTLYMPRKITILTPHFQEQLTPVPDDAEAVWARLKKFDYIIIRMPEVMGKRHPEYNGENNKLDRHIAKLLQQGRFSFVPEMSQTILRVETPAAGNALASKSDNSASVQSAEAALRKAAGKPRPLR